MVTKTLSAFGHPPYAIARKMPDLGFDEAIERVREELGREGFGVLSDVDLREAFRQKLGVGFPRYRMLGACAPELALRALEHQPALGVLLPCNVVVAEDCDGETVVAAVDPDVLLGVVGDLALGPIASEIRDRLERALNRV